MIDPRRTEWILKVDARSLKEEYGRLNDLELNLEGGVWDPVCRLPLGTQNMGKVRTEMSVLGPYKHGS